MGQTSRAPSSTWGYGAVCTETIGSLSVYQNTGARGRLQALIDIN